MDGAMTFLRALVASLTVCRLAHLFLDNRGSDGRGGPTVESETAFLGNRIPRWIPDCICCVGIWLSAQTAVWVAGGVAAVALNCFLFASISRIFKPSESASASSLSLDPATELRKETRNPDFPCLTAASTMQANHV